MIYLLIIILILLTLAITFPSPKELFKPNSFEGFSSDEAVQNIASLYNQQKLTVTNMSATGNSDVAGTLNSKFITAGGIILNGDLTIKDKQKIISAGGVVINGDTISLTGKNGIAIGSNLTTGNISTTGNINTIGNVNTTGNLAVTGNLSAGTIGTDDMVYAGYSAQTSSCPLPTPGQSIGKTHAQLWTTKNACYQVCPPGYYMVGIANGTSWDWKHPLCKKFK